jgi:hypothetical protein
VHACVRLQAAYFSDGMKIVTVVWTYSNICGNQVLQ